LGRGPPLVGTTETLAGLGVQIRADKTCFQEVNMNNDVGKAFLVQARTHLIEDFMPKIEKCLDVLSEEDIWWRAHETNNSVGNLLLHLSGNVRQWIVSGLGGKPDSRRRALEFSERNAIPKKTVWLKLQDSMAEASQVLETFPVEQLLEKRKIQGFDETALQAVFHVVEHFALHTGQIIYITKLRQNKDLKFYSL
jgi:uncharacterized damage-inducible protein DinB